MPTKEHLREPLRKRQDNDCPLCDEPLHDGDLGHLNEVDRLEEGGDYSLENTRLVHRACHLKHHGNAKPPVFPELRAAYDNRMFWMKQRRRLAKQVQDVEKSVWASEITKTELERQMEGCEEHEKYWSRRMKAELRALNHPVVEAALAVRGIGETYVAFLMAVTDIEEASGPRSLMQHLGVGNPDERNPGRGEFRAQLYLLSSGQLKANGPYRSFYNCFKMRHEFNGTKSAHYAALRETAKEILKHFWQAYRELEGLPINKGVKGYSDPRNYGWAL